MGEKVNRIIEVSRRWVNLGRSHPARSAYSTAVGENLGGWRRSVSRAGHWGLSAVQPCTEGAASTYSYNHMHGVRVSPHSRQLQRSHSCIYASDHGVKPAHQGIARSSERTIWEAPWPHIAQLNSNGGPRSRPRNSMLQRGGYSVPQGHTRGINHRKSFIFILRNSSIPRA